MDWHPAAAATPQEQEHTDGESDDEDTTADLDAIAAGLDAERMVAVTDEQDTQGIVIEHSRSDHVDNGRDTTATSLATQPSQKTADDGDYQLVYTDAFHAMSDDRTPVAPTDDDVHVVRRDIKQWVLRVRSACLSNKKGTSTPNRMTQVEFELWLATQEAKVADVDAVDCNQLERNSWALVVCSNS